MLPLLLVIACAPAPVPGSWWVLELDGDAVGREHVVAGVRHREYRVRIGGEEVWWTSQSTEPVEATREGRLALRPVEGCPQWPDPPVDLVERVRIPAAPVERVDAVAASLRVRGMSPVHLPPLQAVDGDLVEVRVPLAAELPPSPVGHRIERVRREILYRPTPGPADPLVGLARGTGDCDERAAALVTLLSEVEVPSRVAQGLVYVAEPPSWVPHAWVLVDQGELGWVPADPSTGAWPAGALRIELPEGWSALATSARPAIEVVEVR